jgi:hypothetical protein
LVIALLITGTYAWTSYRDHKTNETKVGALMYKARLVETYDPTQTLHWKATDPPVTKTISVLNPGAKSEHDTNLYGDIFVRIQLKEFMEFYPTKEVYSAERYMVDTKGEFISFKDRADAEEYEQKIRNEFGNGTHLIVQLRESLAYQSDSYAANKESIDRYIAQYNSQYGANSISVADLTVGGDRATLDPAKVSIDPVHGVDDAGLEWYIQSIASDPNGIYGSFVLLELKSDYNNGDSLVVGQTNKSTSQTEEHNDLIDSAKDDWELNLGTNCNNGECTYTVHTWGEGLSQFVRADWATSTETFDKYIKWYYGPDVMTFTDWIKAGRPTDMWVVDDRLDENNALLSPEGWVYWTGHLEPKQYTTNFLEKIELLLQPSDAFYYAIHTDMQAVSFEDLYRWDMPEEIYEALVKEYVRISSVTVSPTPVYVPQGSTQQFSAQVHANIENIPQDVIWEIDDFFQGSKITQDGILTISEEQPVNSIIKVKAISKYDSTVYGYSIVTVTGSQTIATIELDPEFKIMVRLQLDSDLETSQQFKALWANEAGQWDEVGISQDTTWTVEPFTDGGLGLALSPGTHIDPIGNPATLTIDPNEKNTALKVIATSVYDPTKTAEAIVWIAQAKSVRVDPQALLTLERGITNADAGLVATVLSQIPDAGAPYGYLAVPGGVVWELVGAPTGISIDEDTGYMTIDKNTPEREFQVQARSVYDSTVVSAPKTIKVNTVDVISFDIPSTAFASKTTSTSSALLPVDNKEYRVASSDVATTFTLFTETVGSPATEVEHTPEVMFSNGELNATCSPGKAVIAIPANYAGDLSVTVAAAQDYALAKTHSFILHIHPVAETIQSMTIPSDTWNPNTYNDSIFIAGDWAWRLLNKNLLLNATNTSSNDALIMSMYSIGPSRYSATGSSNTSGGYLNSYLHTSVLTPLYQSDPRFEWAHSVAVEPFTTGSGSINSWTFVGDEQPTTLAKVTNSRTRSTGVLATQNSTVGTFLLSGGDYCSSEYGWTNSMTVGGNQATRQFTRVDGTRIASSTRGGAFWTRSPWTSGTVQELGRNGGWGSTGLSNTDVLNDYMPAMIIKYQ